MSPSAKRELEEPVANGHSSSKPSQHSIKKPRATNPPQLIPQSLSNALYTESNVLKIWNVARKTLGSASPPVLYPEYTGSNKHYVYRNLGFWTSGFFPGSLYLLLERQIKYPQFYAQHETSLLPHRLQLQHLCQWWSTNLHRNASRKDTHDLGFMIAPWAMKAWDLHRDSQAYASLLLAAYNLASRFDKRVQSIRSWDECHTKRYSYTDPDADFLVIIDNMLNLDMLFWAARETGDTALYDIAVAHARTSQKHHIRADKSTFHVVNYDGQTGEPKAKFTHQGYSDGSCWSRGQAWGILGFMQTYEWTKEPEFLTSARELADYFIEHLPDDCVPYWDFDAPINESCPRDTSAGMVACCGLAMLYQVLKDTDAGAAEFYLDSALRILDGTISLFMTTSPANFVIDASETDLATYPETEQQRQPGALAISTRSLADGVGMSQLPETILDAATVCNYEFAKRRWADHGLVYADYYFLLFGNMLLEMGIVKP